MGNDLMKSVIDIDGRSASSCVKVIDLLRDFSSNLLH